jgi:hypothetical protein
MFTPFCDSAHLRRRESSNPKSQRQGEPQHAPVGSSGERISIFIAQAEQAYNTLATAVVPGVPAPNTVGPW